MTTIIFTTAVYPLQSVKAAVRAFAPICACRIDAADEAQTIVAFDESCSAEVPRELANFALEHAMSERE